MNSFFQESEFCYCVKVFSWDKGLSYMETYQFNFDSSMLIPWTVKIVKESKFVPVSSIRDVI